MKLNTVEEKSWGVAKQVEEHQGCQSQGGLLGNFATLESFSWEANRVDTLWVLSINIGEACH